MIFYGPTLSRSKIHSISKGQVASVAATVMTCKAELAAQSTINLCLKKISEQMLKKKYWWTLMNEMQ